MQSVIVKKSISAELADMIIKSAIAAAIAVKKYMVIAIVDESGHLKTFHRMDGSALISIEVAQIKAYSAVANAWGFATHEIFEQSQKSPATKVGIPLLPNYTVLGGGFPIRVDGNIVGGIGVSGGSIEEDISIAQAALEIIK
ncbi:MAG: cobalamin adenosyltransferase [Chlamydiae bacterium CG10_big_fil_rev_8_21_14_0_10_35_9]|nr:MAG: cobalamin adenosyltransferase [Chlamydiae bacterium CG10_big_fil_rev_8_21_14_0_10_35_9]